MLAQRLDLEADGRVIDDRVPHHRGDATGLALVDDGLAEFECRTVSTLDAGDHTIVVGEVLTLAVGDAPEDALTYYRGAFGRLR